MKKNLFISLFFGLGEYLRSYLNGELQDRGLDEAIDLSYGNNPLFTPFFQKYALSAIAENFLKKDMLDCWIGKYDSFRESDGSFGLGNKESEIVMAGNIPLVGFHDLMTVIAVGLKATVKLSSKDPFLIPAVLKIIKKLDGGVEVVDRVKFIDKDYYQKEQSSPDSLIMMGSDRSASFFENRYPFVPKLIRKSKTSVGVVRKNIDDDELRLLASDVLLYYGMGCRSITHLKVERDFDMNRLISALGDCSSMTDNNVMKNIFRRNSAIYTMEGIPFYEGGNMVVIEDDNYTHAPGVVSYSWIETIEALEEEFESNRELIQKIYLNFGQAQRPQVGDYPDDKDTMLFLLNNLK